MTLDKLIANYDPIDVKYKERFCNDCIPQPRKINPKYLSFISVTNIRETNKEGEDE